MSEDINVTDGTILEALNGKVDVDFNNVATNSVGFARMSTEVTNCITEIPQRIKLELDNGTLTLKAGSEVIVPNGKNADGSLKFDYVTVESDLPMSSSWGTAEKMAIFVSPDATSLSMVGLARLSSGATAPTATTTQRWYDTNTNLVKAYTGGSYSGLNVSFPIAICTKTSASEDKILASIDQVFNGMGYIGSTVWVDKGVKGLIPNGRNEDGNLKNIEFTTDKVIIGNYNTGVDREISVAINNSVVGFGFYYLDDKSNVIKTTTDANLRQLCIIADVSVTSSNNITSFNPKQPFRAVDYNELVEATKDVLKQPKGFGSGFNIGSGWTATSNGLVRISGFSDSKGNSATLNIDGASIYVNVQSGSGSNHHDIVSSFPIYKGQIVTYSGGGINDCSFYPYAY